MVLVAAMLGGVVAGLLRGATAPVPSLTQGALAPVPVVAVIALVPTVGVIWGWSGLPWQGLASAARPALLLMCPLLLASPLAFIAGAAVTGGMGSVLENGRNAIGLLGLSVIGARLLGERGAVLAPVGYLLAAFMVGRPTGIASAHRWAWILSDGGNALSLGIALALLTFGMTAVPTLARSLLRRGQE